MNKKGKISIWDLLLYLGAGIILVWAFLKAFGVINSPVWFEILPYFGIGVSLVGGAYKLGKIMNGIEYTNRKVNKLLEIGSRFEKLENEHNLCMEGKLKIHKK